MLETVCDETCIISDTEREKIIIYILFNTYVIRPSWIPLKTGNHVKLQE